MRYDREAYVVKRKTHIASHDNHCPHTTRYRCETSRVKRAFFRRCDASRFTFHERRGHSQEGW